MRLRRPVLDTRERFTLRANQASEWMRLRRPVLDTRERFTPRSASGVGVGPHALKKSMTDSYQTIRDLIDRVRRRWRTLHAFEAIVRAAIASTVRELEGNFPNPTPRTSPLPRAF